MQIAPLQRQMHAEDIDPERLQANSQLSEKEKVAEASRQFEAMLLRQILENTQKTVIKSKFSDNSTSSSIYRDLITNQLADSISKSGDFGLAKTFEQQLDRSAPPTPKAGDGGTPDASPTSKKEPASRPHSGNEEPREHHVRSHLRNFIR
jgi:flagellar protein FlgJ